MNGYYGQALCKVVSKAEAIGWSTCQTATVRDLGVVPGEGLDSPGGSLARRPGTSKRPGHHTRSWVDGREARQVSWASGLCLDTTASQQPPLTTLLYPEIVTVALMSAIVRLMVYFQENRQGMSLDDHHCALSLA